MSRTEQTHPIAGPVHDQRKEIGDVAPKDAHVQGFQIREGCELTAKDSHPTIVAFQSDGGIHENCGRRAAHATQGYWDG
jgi:hypothetical protein